MTESPKSTEVVLRMTCFEVKDNILILTYHGKTSAYRLSPMEREPVEGVSVQKVLPEPTDRILLLSDK